MPSRRASCGQLFENFKSPVMQVQCPTPMLFGNTFRECTTTRSVNIATRVLSPHQKHPPKEKSPHAQALALFVDTQGMLSWATHSQMARHSLNYSLVWII